MSISSESSAESAPQVSPEPAPEKGPPRNLATGVIKALRPRQWVKNVLVFAAPVAALGDDRYTYDYREVLVRVLLAFVVFSLAASCVYLVNDARDVEADRRTRPNGSARSQRAWCPSGWPTHWPWCSAPRRW